jgi:hypothetical protein
VTTFDPPHPRDVNRDKIRKALRASFPENDSFELEHYGDGLTAIAEAQDIPMEALIFWIHDKPAGKDFSQNGWRIWCARYSTVRDLLPPEAAAIQPATPEEQEECPDCQLYSDVTTPGGFFPCKKHRQQSPPALCTHCYAQAVRQIDGRWWCPRCGEVQL